MGPLRHAWDARAGLAALASSWGGRAAVSSSALAPSGCERPSVQWATSWPSSTTSAFRVDEHLAQPCRCGTQAGAFQAHQTVAGAKPWLCGQQGQLLVLEFRGDGGKGDGRDGIGVLHDAFDG